ncbi:MAG: hypothetical protein IBV52_01510 [Candidatus Bathyarchaeota archaeon]
MPKDDATEILLKEHEELVSLYMHESKIKSSLISVYTAFNIGLASAIVVLIQGEEIPRMRAISFLCFMGFLFSLAGIQLFKKNQHRISKWVKEGKEVEKTLGKKALTINVFGICEESSEKQTGILDGRWGLTILWLLIAIAMMLVGMEWIQLSFFP